METWKCSQQKAFWLVTKLAALVVYLLVSRLVPQSGRNRLDIQFTLDATKLRANHSLNDLTVLFQWRVTRFEKKLLPMSVLYLLN